MTPQGAPRHSGGRAWLFATLPSAQYVPAPMVTLLLSVIAASASMVTELTFIADLNATALPFPCVAIPSLPSMPSLQ